MLNALFSLIAQAANVATTSMAPDAPVTVNSIVVIMTATGVLLGILGTFIMQVVNAIIALRNGMKSDVNAAKADVNAAKQDATHAKLDGVSKQLNGELDAKLNKLAATSFAAGASSVTEAAAPAATQPLTP